MHKSHLNFKFRWLLYNFITIEKFAITTLLKKIIKRKKRLPKTSEAALFRWWAHLGSNQRPTGYEPVALPLSYRPDSKLQVIFPVKPTLTLYNKTTLLSRLLFILKILLKAYYAWGYAIFLKLWLQSV